MFNSPIILATTQKDVTFEIFLLLIVFFILGFLVHHYLSKNKIKQNSQHSQHALHNNTRDTKLEEKIKTPNPIIHETVKVPEKPNPIINLKQDLKIIEGIGPKSEQALNDANIISFANLANKTPLELRKILDAKSDNFSLLNTETWPPQAALARDGKMHELEDYKKILIYGI